VSRLAPLARPFLERAPWVRVVALGCPEVADALDLAPFGVPVTFVDAVRDTARVARYLEANRARFGGAVALPGWVLADLYLMPAAVTVLEDSSGEVLAAYYAAPTVEPGCVVGVSLFSTREGLGAATAAKALGLGILRARTARGVTQWRSRALRVHARFGDLSVEGPAPAVHGLAGESFRYRTELDAPVHGEAHPVPVEVAQARVTAGERLRIATPGGDGTRVWVRGLGGGG
jgi:hypothetical protein